MTSNVRCTSKVVSYVADWRLALFIFFNFHHGLGRDYCCVCCGTAWRFCRLDCNKRSSNSTISCERAIDKDLRLRRVWKDAGARPSYMGVFSISISSCIFDSSNQVTIRSLVGYSLSSSNGSTEPSHSSGPSNLNCAKSTWTEASHQKTV